MRMSFMGLLVMVLSLPAQASLLFSEYVEGSSWNKALEIYNFGPDLDFGVDTGYAVEIYTNGASSASKTIDLAGTLAADSVFILSHTSADAALTGMADMTSGSLSFNGDDAIALLHNGVLLDSIGQIGIDPGAEWGSGGVTTKDHTLVRASSILTGDIDALDSFDPAVQWLGFAQDSFANLGQHTVAMTAGSRALPASASVPSPGSLALLGAGFLGLWGMRRRQQRV